MISISHRFIENFFLVRNNPFLLRRRNFRYMSYFEKLFLVVFHKKGWFERTIANLYRKKDIIDYRRNHYPLINIFHLYSNRMEYEMIDLKIIVKQYRFYFKNKAFNFKLNKILNFCFKKSNIKFIKFLIIQQIFIKRYFYSYSSFFYKEQNNLNLLKLNFVFNIFLLNSKGRFLVFDLSKWDDWYFFAFTNKIKKYYNIKSKLTVRQWRNYMEFKSNRYAKWVNMVYKYKKRYVSLSRDLRLDLAGLIFFRFSFRSFFLVTFYPHFRHLLKKYYTIKFSESSVSKHINTDSLKDYNISYLRKNRIFNKGRYSRNRQLYRTGVYWCLWLNIIMVYGLYFMFYRFSFNFGYIWWGILILAYSTIFSRVVKYNYFNLYYVYREFIALQNWYGYIFREAIFFSEWIVQRYLVNVNIFNYIAKYKDDKYAFYFDNYYYYFVHSYLYWMRKKYTTKITYMWQGMKEHDTSFLRYKTVIHWTKEMYKLITIW